MSDTNPYQSSAEHVQDPNLKEEAPSKARWALMGSVIGAALPIGYGVYGMQQHYASVAALAPNEGACGMGALSALAMICVVGPFCGIFGAASGWAAATVRQWAGR